LPGAAILTYGFCLIRSAEISRTTLFQNNAGTKVPFPSIGFMALGYMN
jgi:hypothetical protein